MTEAEIRGILNLTEEENDYLQGNFSEFDFEELLDEAKKFDSYTSEKLRLQSEYAGLNYKIYESFMTTHQNTIAISGMYSELRISSTEIEKQKLGRIEYLLSKYLLIRETW